MCTGFSSEAQRNSYAIFEAAMDRWAAGRRFCASEAGYIGWVPQTADVGDMLCVILGAEVPFVLRKRPSGQYQLIGECYVHGFMYGEVFDRLGHDTMTVVLL